MTVFLNESLFWLVHAAAVVLCLSGIFISVLSFTGAWLVTGAAGILYLYRDDASVTLTLLVVFVVIGILVELFDFFAGNLGIARRGGSRVAGWAALGGGIVGMLLGAFIPLPVLGSIIGMCVGSFLCAYAVEHRRLKHHGHAAHIARGVVWARLGVMFVKTATAMGMTCWLGYVLLR